MYPEFKDGMKCLLCLGCNLLLDYRFLGKYSCDDFREGYSIEEKFKRLNTYGSVTGDNR